MPDLRFKLPSAVYLFMEQDNQLLLQRRFNTGYMDGYYSLIAGHLDGNEAVKQAMIREAREEAGIILLDSDLKPATVLHRRSADAEYVDFFLHATNWQGEPQIMEPHKCDHISWFPKDQLPENLVPHVKEAWENFQTGLVFGESGWK